MDHFKITFTPDCSAGECIYMDVKFTFHLCNCKKEGSSKRLVISVISPSTQRILQSSLKLKKLEKAGKITSEDKVKLRKGQSLEKLNAETSAVFRREERWF